MENFILTVDRVEKNESFDINVIFNIRIGDMKIGEAKLLMSNLQIELHNKIKDLMGQVQSDALRTLTEKVG